MRRSGAGTAAWCLSPIPGPCCSPRILALSPGKWSALNRGRAYHFALDTAARFPATSSLQTQISIDQDLIVVLDTPTWLRPSFQPCVAASIYPRALLVLLAERGNGRDAHHAWEGTAVPCQLTPPSRQVGPRTAEAGSCGTTWPVISPIKAFGHPRLGSQCRPWMGS